MVHLLCSGLPTGINLLVLLGILNYGTHAYSPPEALQFNERVDKARYQAACPDYKMYSMYPQ